MKRRDFKRAALTVGASALLPTLSHASLLKPPRGEKIPKGVVTLYFEFRILGSKRDDLMIRHIRKFAKKAEEKKGFLSLSFKAGLIAIIIAMVTRCYARMVDRYHRSDHFCRTYRL